MSRRTTFDRQALTDASLAMLQSEPHVKRTVQCPGCDRSILDWPGLPTDEAAVHARACVELRTIAAQRLIVEAGV